MASTTSAKNNHDALKKIHLTNPIHFLAVGFGSGLISPAPGTWGTLAGLIVGAILLQWCPLPYFLLLIMVAFLLGCYLCAKTAKDMQVHDHGAIVWDEIVAIWLVLAALPELSLIWYIVAFVLFRLFDILKPMPIRYFDRKLHTGFGIMFDDLLAALYAILVITLCHWFI
ncbi:phosphatidylglycerophosphatase A [Gallibacterium salpingitidis]|uniref:Phosphatidylglycerophosphatase A n=1 Tax=Gallibacterium salpingitidis TaxID=505341 RepID=A0A1A7NS35_9PAST|nr:phosphatidylglycerophosphatase A [Gallibacterium salpingitidis]OBW92326.1 phosphatidylglycerophosphatase [Gallibacterium salpingitidis]